MAPSHWVHDLSPFLIEFAPGVGLRYYGLAYVLGLVGGGFLLAAYAAAGRSLLPRPKVADSLVTLMIGIFVGGRLGYFLLYHPALLAHDPLLLFKVWEGGMASHGGFLGVAAALAWIARAEKLPFLHLSDLIVSTAPLGLFLGRIANFINGELWGRVADVRWAVIFPRSAPDGTPPLLIEPRHPSQLYEAALEGLLLLAWLQLRFWKSSVVRDRPGRLTGEFLLLYAIVRVIGEQFREPDEGVSPLFGLSRGAFYSLFVAAAGLALIFWPRRPLHAQRVR